MHPQEERPPRSRRPRDNKRRAKALKDSAVETGLMLTLMQTILHVLDILKHFGG